MSDEGMTNPNATGPNDVPFDLGPGKVWSQSTESKFGFVGLDDDQANRVFALQHARELLSVEAQTDTLQIGSVTRQFRKPYGQPDAEDMVNVAAYIVTGADPWRDEKVHDGEVQG